jgi:hypothetical protein
MSTTAPQRSQVTMKQQGRPVAVTDWYPYGVGWCW